MKHHPVFTIDTWEHDPQGVSKDDGLSENPCWPKRIAPLDPGFTLLTFDKYYNGNAPPYNYADPYEPGKNGKRDLGANAFAEDASVFVEDAYFNTTLTSEGE